MCPDGTLLKSARDRLSLLRRYDWRWYNNTYHCNNKKTIKQAHSMASFSRRPSRLWTIDECALFEARKEFELLKLLSIDKKAMAAARRLGLHAGLMVASIAKSWPPC